MRPPLTCRRSRDGSDFVVGPLTREEVAALATPGRWACDDARAQFPAGQRAGAGPLLPVRPVARRRGAARRAAHRRRRPLERCGTRAAIRLGPPRQAAFADEFAAAGGQIVDHADYLSSTADFNEILRRLLRTTGQRGSSPRADAQFIFVAAQPVHGRLIRTQLRFNYASALPMYATSDIFDPAGPGNVDLDGVIFPDMPWILDPLGRIGGGARHGRARLSRGGGQLTVSTPSATTPIAWSASCRGCAAAARVPARRNRPARRGSPGPRAARARLGAGRQRARRALAPRSAAAAADREHRTAPRARPCGRGGGGAPAGTPGLPDSHHKLPRQGGELDLVALDGAVLAIVEVRYRALGPLRRRRGRASRTQAQPHRSRRPRPARVNPPLAKLPARFDVVEVSGPADDLHCDLIRAAFSV